DRQGQRQHRPGYGAQKPSDDVHREFSLGGEQNRRSVALAQIESTPGGSKVSSARLPSVPPADAPGGGGGLSRLLRLSMDRVALALARFSFNRFRLPFHFHRRSTLR